MKYTNRTNGIAFTATLLIIAGVGLLGLIGYEVYSENMVDVDVSADINEEQAREEIANAQKETIDTLSQIELELRTNAEYTTEAAQEDLAELSDQLDSAYANATADAKIQIKQMQNQVAMFWNSIKETATSTAEDIDTNLDVDVEMGADATVTDSGI